MKNETLRVNDSTTIKELVEQYATNYWAGSWKELLVDPDGTQYGTYDETGSIYPETLQLLDKYQIQIQPNWPQVLWEMAGNGQISLNDKPLKQFWTLGSATKEVLNFISPLSEGGYDGNYLGRGMMPIAIDPENPDKMIFAVQINKLWPR